MSNFLLRETREGVPTLEFLEDKKRIILHSRYAPLREAAQLINARKAEIEQADVILVYGIGLGYHLKELEKYRLSTAKVFVLEMNLNIKEYAEQHFSISAYEQIGYTFLFTDHVKEAALFIADLVQEYKERELFLLIHNPSLKIIPQKCQVMKEILENWEIKRDTFQRYSGLMKTNFKENMQYIDTYYNLKPFQSQFKDFPVVIVSSGPSLDQNKHLLQKLKNKVLIFAVGSAVMPLMKIGLIPDCTIITDPHPIVRKQLENLDLKIPLFFFPTIQPKIVQKYQGPKVVMFQKGFEQSEQFVAKHDLILTETGGSVATTALELAIFFGGNPVIFVGQDLAYTDNRFHAAGTMHERVKIDKKTRMVQGIDGELVSTSKSFSIYLTWMAEKIHQHPKIDFIDATEGGAYIPGTMVKKLSDVIDEIDNQEIKIERLLYQALKGED